MPYWFDGNNLIGQSAAAARLDSKTRQSFLGLLSEYAATRGGSFLVFFDGDDSARILPPKGVRVRYSAPWSTDDAILRAAESARSPREIVVVTNDNGLAGRCRTAGTRTISWRQFTDTMAKSRTRPGRTRTPEAKVDVADWSRFFGLDPDDLN